MSNSDLSSRVRSSILALQGRQAAMLVINLGVGIILARRLGPELFGLFGIASFCMSIITIFTDFGIAASLIQRKESFGEKEISVAFTLQLLICLCAACVIWVLAPLTLHLYRGIDPDLVWIIRSLTLPLLLSAIGTAARVQLERDIMFKKIAAIDLTALVSSNVVILSLVFSGFGVWSLVWGNITTAVVGTIHAWLLIKIKPRIRFDRGISKGLLSFGVFFQLGNITNSAAGWIVPLIAGTRLGPASVGLLTWASSNGRRPLMVVDSVMKVAFPHFSRLQNQPEELSRQIGLYFRRLLTLCYGWAFLALVLGEPVTHFVYTIKWIPGLIALQLFALGLAFDVMNWVGGMTLTALGGVKLTAKWTMIKSVLAISVALLTVDHFGIAAIPVASIIASTVSSYGILLALRKMIEIPWKDFVAPGLPFAFLTLLFFGFGLASSELQSTFAWPLGCIGLGWLGIRGFREFRKSPSIVEPSRSV